MRANTKHYFGRVLRFPKSVFLLLMGGRLLGEPTMAVFGTVQTMAERLAGGDYDQLRHFIAAGSGSDGPSG
jgi:hypothetical protein